MVKCVLGCPEGLVGSQAYEAFHTDLFYCISCFDFFPCCFLNSIFSLTVCNAPWCVPYSFSHCFLPMFVFLLCLTMLSQWFLIVSLMLQLENVSKLFVWISRFPFSAFVYLTTYSQLPPTSAAKISVRILETLQPASSKLIFLDLDLYPISKKSYFSWFPLTWLVHNLFY